MQPNSRILQNQGGHFILSRTIEQQRLYIDQSENDAINIVCTRYAINTNVAQGIKGLLHVLEDGHTGLIHFQSELDFGNSLLPITYIRSAFDAVKHNTPKLRLSKEMGEESQWESLLLDLQKNKCSLDKLLIDRGYQDNFEEDFFKKSTGLEYKNWLFLKQFFRLLYYCKTPAWVLQYFFCLSYYILWHIYCYKINTKK